MKMPPATFGPLMAMKMIPNRGRLIARSSKIPMAWSEEGSSSRPKKLKLDQDTIVKSIVEEVRKELDTKVSGKDCVVYGGCRGSGSAIT